MQFDPSCIAHLVVQSIIFMRVSATTVLTSVILNVIFDMSSDMWGTRLDFLVIIAPYNFFS